MKLSSLLVFSSVLFIGTTALSSCNPNSIPEKDIPVIPCEDDYRTMYQIMPYSFADSDGDGIGDLQGIIDKLDYIHDLGFNGLWLTPVQQSSSYHKYDIDDYMSIDSKFGTIDDYKTLVNECHDKDMTIILDLVFNHTSDDHQWFKKSMAAASREKYDDPYYSYYVWNHDTSVPSGYTQIASNLSYESRFWSGMPDLNLQEVLDHPDGQLASDLKEIMRFWLEDCDVDGFRLDAVTSYFTGNVANNTAFLTWLNDTAESIKPDVYIVGEGNWGGYSNENATYNTSGVNGFFNFETSTAGGEIASIINTMRPSTYAYAINKMWGLCEGTDAIPTPFIANHDNGRMLGFLSGRDAPERMKFGYALLQMLPGATYHYYGDEVGMAAIVGSDGKVKDEDKRQPMPWGDEYTCKPILGSTNASDDEKYPYGTVKDNLKDTNSIINFIKKVNTVRNQHLEITHGSAEQIYRSVDMAVTATIRSYQGQSILVVINAHSSQSKTYNFEETQFSEVVGQLACQSGTYIQQKDKNVKEIIIPPMGIAIIA